MTTVPQAPGSFVAARAAGAGALRLPRIERPLQHLAMHLFGRAAVSELTLQDQVLTWRWHPALAQDAPALTLLCAAGEVRCALCFDGDDGPGLDDAIDLDAFTGPALLAAAAVRYAALLAHLERLSGRRFECINLRRGAFSLDAQALPLGFTIGEPAQAPRALHGVLQVLPSQAAFWSALHGRAAAPPHTLAHLPVAAQLWLSQSVAVPAAALRRLRVGGALLLGAAHHDGLLCRLRWPGRLPDWSALVHGTTVQLRSAIVAPANASSATNRSSTMDSTPATTDEHSSAASAAVDTMPIVLEFHLGQVVLPLSELSAALAPGYVIELGRPLDTNAVAVRANGQLLAHGELIQVGDQLAVRISRIASDPNSDGSV